LQRDLKKEVKIKLKKKIFVAKKTIVITKKQEYKTKKIANTTKQIAKTIIIKITIVETKITKNIETNKKTTYN